jgi:hypothetical protein
MAGGVERQAGYKKLNGQGRIEVVVKYFLLFFRGVVRVQVFLYRRRKRIFPEENRQCREGLNVQSDFVGRGTKNYTWLAGISAQTAEPLLRFSCL